MKKESDDSRGKLYLHNEKTKTFPRYKLRKTRNWPLAEERLTSSSFKEYSTVNVQDQNGIPQRCMTQEPTTTLQYDNCNRTIMMRLRWSDNFVLLEKVLRIDTRQYYVWGGAEKNLEHRIQDSVTRDTPCHLSPVSQSNESFQVPFQSPFLFFWRSQNQTERNVAVATQAKRGKKPLQYSLVQPSRTKKWAHRQPKKSWSRH